MPRVAATSWLYARGRDDRFYVKVRYTVMDLDQRLLWLGTYHGESDGDDVEEGFGEALREQFERASKGLTSYPWWQARASLEGGSS